MLSDPDIEHLTTAHPHLPSPARAPPSLLSRPAEGILPSSDAAEAMSSEAYERERQNNALLDTLGSKVTELRDITVNIYDNARDHDLIDSNVRPPSPSPPKADGEKPHTVLTFSPAADRTLHLARLGPVQQRVAPDAHGRGREPRRRV